MFEHSIKLGDKVRDRITKIEGVAVGYMEWLNKCIRFGIQREGTDKDGKQFDIFWVDDVQLEVVDRKTIVVEKEYTGGPRDVGNYNRPDPTRR